MQRKTLVCLANSRKHNGRCIAGIELNGDELGDWIRPVSERSGHEVSEWERNYEDGSDPQVLDIVSVPLLNAVPSGYQSENWLIEGNYYWIREDRVSWDDLSIAESERAKLWSNKASDSYNGINDRITLEMAADEADSLRFIRADDLKLRVLNGLNKRQVRAALAYNGDLYDLGVTDPVITKEYLSQPNDTYSIGHAFLTISLGEQFDGYCYKLAAAVVTESRAKGTGAA